MCTLSEIEAKLRGQDDLRQRIVRNLGTSTVALFGIFDADGADLLKLAGTGTLMVVDDSFGILTAAHVWDESLKLAAKVGITLTDNINHKTPIDVQAITPTIIKSVEWNEWGQDLAFLRIPSELTGGIKAFQVFEDFKAPPRPLQEKNTIIMILRSTSIAPECLKVSVGSVAEVCGEFWFTAPR